MNITLLGCPGAGKGTQAAILSRKLRVPTISTGQLLREAVAEGSPLGIEVKELIARGELVPDDTVLSMLKERLREPDCQKGFILDGVPRTIEQAEALEEMGLEIHCCLYFDVADEVIIQRLAARRTCKDCGSVFQLKVNPPRKEGVCDFCNGELVTRPDDEPKTVRRRLDIYHGSTESLVEYYRGRGKLREIPSAGSVEETAHLVTIALGECGEEAAYGGRCPAID